MRSRLPDAKLSYAADWSEYHHTKDGWYNLDKLWAAEAVDVVGIDEAQFFDIGLVDVCNQLAGSGVRVIIAGLDMDFTGKPFGVMPNLMATAEYVTKVHAICVKCGSLAQFSHRKTTDEQQVMLGETESYEPLCRVCFNKSTESK